MDERVAKMMRRERLKWAIADAWQVGKAVVFLVGIGAAIIMLIAIMGGEQSEPEAPKQGHHDRWGNELGEDGRIKR
jgi:hypothetical protein